MKHDNNNNSFKRSSLKNGSTFKCHLLFALSLLEHVSKGMKEIKLNLPGNSLIVGTGIRFDAVLLGAQAKVMTVPRTVAEWVDAVVHLVATLRRWAAALQRSLTHSETLQHMSYWVEENLHMTVVGEST